MIVCSFVYVRGLKEERDHYSKSLYKKYRQIEVGSTDREESLTKYFERNKGGKSELKFTMDKVIRRKQISIITTLPLIFVMSKGEKDKNPL